MLWQRWFHPLIPWYAWSYSQLVGSTYKQTQPTRIISVTRRAKSSHQKPIDIITKSNLLNYAILEEYVLCISVEILVPTRTATDHVPLIRRKPLLSRRLIWSVDIALPSALSLWAREYHSIEQKRAVSDSSASKIVPKRDQGGRAYTDSPAPPFFLSKVVLFEIIHSIKLAVPRSESRLPSLTWLQTFNRHWEKLSIGFVLNAILLSELRE